VTAAPVTLRCTGLAGGGWGVAHSGSTVWLVRGALPGEIVRAEFTFQRGGVVHGRATEVLDDHHPARLPTPCPQAPRCGGCDWPHVDAMAGAALKSQVASGAARGNPYLREVLAGAAVTTSPPAYRLRARLHWDPAARILGFFAQRSWEVQPVAGCAVLSPGLLAILPELESALGRSCPVPADLEWLEDLDGTTAVVGLRPASPGPRRLRRPMLPLEGSLPEPVAGAWILSRSGRPEGGWGRLSVTMALPTPLSVPIGAFFQGNRHLVPWLFHRVRELAGSPSGGIWDLHAGVGFLAAAARTQEETHLTLVEPFRPAARASAVNLPGAKVLAGITAETYLQDLSDLPPEALVIADPPRSGLSKRLRRQLLSWGPRRILMLSCDPGTWARDASALMEAGYELGHVELVDLFPSTHHVETVSILEKP